MNDTIFAVSSGSPPAAIAVVRISGPDAGKALDDLAGKRPLPRRASVRRLFDTQGELLDRAMVLWLPGPGTATGEDIVELHLHGGRAVVAAAERTLSLLAGVRPAAPGEFTRRAFSNGRIDLAEAEGLADLLTAETELQRQQALSLVGGEFSRLVKQWRHQVLMASAEVEAMLDFGDEDDVDELSVQFSSRMSALANEMQSYLDQPRAEILRDGFRVVLAGPPNSGKSSLFNRLVEEEAAITAPTAGTTRDILSRPVGLAGIPFMFADTAGVRDLTSDPIEAIGIDRAKGEFERADLVLWLGESGEGFGKVVWEIESFADVQASEKIARHRVSAKTGMGIAELRQDLIAVATRAMPRPGTMALNQRHHSLVWESQRALEEGASATDPLIYAECLRQALRPIDRLLGQADVESMLDALFSRFCIGK